MTSGAASPAAGEPIAIVAGNGRLPHYVAEAARRAGNEPFIIRLSGESSDDWTGYSSMEAGLGAFAPVVAALKQRGISKVVLSGGVRTRPEWSSLRPTFRILLALPAIWRKLSSGGDDKVLRMVIALFEQHGFEIIGAQAIAGELLVGEGALGAVTPDEKARADIAAACEAARAIGLLDIGQGAVSVGGRVVAVEGAEGTDQMLDRVRWMREVDRVSPMRPGVLVKLCKPQQEERADLPSIGPETVRAAIAAGLSGIAIEAGRALILDRAETIRAADAAGLFIFGLTAAETEGGSAHG
ncbi:LpxI family protein [Martelella endophytica]|uniref:LpxI family protein n=1 Tax=Martelella endophytica TaxID=1486262 RepID=UPI0005F22FDC|nr:UDP-2,3-diacylglucosamine diphosphatase LpxI [Martelella endophytica]